MSYKEKINNLKVETIQCNNIIGDNLEKIKYNVNGLRSLGSSEGYKKMTFDVNDVSGIREVAITNNGETGTFNEITIPKTGKYKVAIEWKIYNLKTESHAVEFQFVNDTIGTERILFTKFYKPYRVTDDYTVFESCGYGSKIFQLNKGEVWYVQAISLMLSYVGSPPADTHSLQYNLKIELIE